MKKLTYVLSLLILLGTTGLASASEVVVAGPGPEVAVAVTFPGFRLVFGHPGIYCWYGGHYYTRAAWLHFRRLHRHPIAYRYHRDYGRF